MCLHIRPLGAIPDLTQQGVLITSVGEYLMENVRQHRDWALSCTCGMLCDDLPILPFFWFEIFMTARSAFSSNSSGDVRGITTPALNKPIFHTTNCLMRVADTWFLFLITNRGFVYSPTRNKKWKASSTRQTIIRISGLVDILTFV